MRTFFPACVNHPPDPLWDAFKFQPDSPALLRDHFCTRMQKMQAIGRMLRHKAGASQLWPEASSQECTCKIAG